jgi:hypothetical protein
MEGRFKQGQSLIGQLQETVTELGNEVVQLQATPRYAPPTQVVPPAVPMLRPEDEQTYGADFLDVAQRAALQAVAPQLQRLEQRNQQLERRLQQTSIEGINSALDREVPNWTQINLSPKFKNWLRIRDIYSGRVRQDLLKEAHSAANAARVVSFFKGFLDEEEATGSNEFGQQPSPVSALPVTPQLSLQALSTPGHMRPAQGVDPNQSAANPIWITTGQIKAFYENIRRGVYLGRDADRANDEAIIFDCQRNCRVRDR